MSVSAAPASHLIITATSRRRFHSLLIANALVQYSRGYNVLGDTFTFTYMKRSYRSCLDAYEFHTVQELLVFVWFTIPQDDDVAPSLAGHIQTFVGTSLPID